MYAYANVSFFLSYALPLKMKLSIIIYLYVYIFGGKNCQKEYNIYPGGNLPSLRRRRARTTLRERKKRERDKECGSDGKMGTNYLLTGNQNSEQHFGTEKKNLSPETF